MSVTPALSNTIVGKWQKRISTMLHLDIKDSEFIHLTLEQFALELATGLDRHSNLMEDPGDVNDYKGGK